MGISSLLGSFIGADQQSDAAEQSANVSLYGTQLAIEAQKDMFNKLMALQKPYNEFGVKALDKIGGVDPTGGAGQYMEALPEFSYSFNENDPAYQFKLKEAQKAIDAASAARGNYNSRAAINASSEAQQAITADEVDKQFSRAKDIYGIDYAKNIDLYNMAAQLGGIQYNAALDPIKIGQGSAASAGAGATATGQGISSAYMNMIPNLINAYQAKGNAWSDFYSGAGAQPMNDWMTYMAFSNMGGGGGWG